MRPSAHRILPLLLWFALLFGAPIANSQDALRGKALYTNTSAIAAGRELGTDLVLEGRFQRVGERIRVTAQLIRVEDSATVWAGTFDERYTDVFGVQDEIAERVAAALARSITPQEKRQLSRRDTASTAAYEAYLKGRYFWGKRNEDGLKHSIAYFETALRIDPRYALAHAGLSDAYNLVGAYGAFRPRDAFVRAKAEALLALELDDKLAAAHASLAFAKAHHDHDWSGADQGYRKAIALEPGYATAHQWYALSMAAQGRIEAAIRESQEALRADPLSLIINTDAGRHLYYARRYDEAIEQFRRTVDLDASFMRAHLELGRAYKMKGLHDLAIAELQLAVQLSNGSAAEAFYPKGATSAQISTVGLAFGIFFPNEYRGPPQ